jgi:hypothetical protein
MSAPNLLGATLRMLSRLRKPLSRFLVRVSCALGSVRFHDAVRRGSILALLRFGGVHDKPGTPGQESNHKSGGQFSHHYLLPAVLARGADSES